MKVLFSSVLALGLASSAFAKSPYELVSVPHSEIDSHLVIGSDATGTPANLQGLWWMNGNPLPDEVVSFAGMSWTDIVEDGEVVGHRGFVPVYDEGVWSWHDSVYGRGLYDLVLQNKLTYEVVFNADYTEAQVTPRAKLFGLVPQVTLPPSMLVDFDMRLVDENEFARDSVIFGQPSSYRFRRIVDGQGKRLPAFQEFLAAVEAPNALLPVCKDPASTSLPSTCVKKLVP